MADGQVQGSSSAGQNALVAGTLLGAAGAGAGATFAAPAKYKSFEDILKSGKDDVVELSNKSGLSDEQKTAKDKIKALIEDLGKAKETNKSAVETMFGKESSIKMDDAGIKKIFGERSGITAESLKDGEALKAATKDIDDTKAVLDNVLESSKGEIPDEGIKLGKDGKKLAADAADDALFATIKKNGDKLEIIKKGEAAEVLDDFKKAKGEELLKKADKKDLINTLEKNGDDLVMNKSAYQEALDSTSLKKMSALSDEGKTAFGKIKGLMKNKNKGAMIYGGIAAAAGLLGGYLFTGKSTPEA